MNKSLLSIAMASVALVSANVSASGLDNVGVGVNYGLFSGPTLELTYPINNTFQLRGALSNGMGLTETTSDTDIDYDVEADGGIHRIAVDYHPFEGSFFLSGGYAVNNFSLDASGSGSVSDTIEIGNDEYDVDSDLTLNGNLDWDSGPTLSLGWGHSPAEGWGAMFEVGVIFTGSAKVSLSGSGTVTDTQTSQTYDVSDSQEVRDSLDAEEKKIEEDVGDYSILPILQAGVTYRF